MVSTRAQITKTGQHTTTIPKNLAQAMEITKGTILRWKVSGRNKLEIQIQEADDEE